jgi:hypothetical protein
MSIESNLEGLPDRHTLYGGNQSPKPAKKRSTFEDDSLWERTAEAPWKLELLTIFLRNQLRVAPAMPLLTIMLAFFIVLYGLLAAVDGVLMFRFGRQALSEGDEEHGASTSEDTPSPDDEPVPALTY